MVLNSKLYNQYTWIQNIKECELTLPQLLSVLSCFNNNNNQTGGLNRYIITSSYDMHPKTTKRTQFGVAFYRYHQILAHEINSIYVVWQRDCPNLSRASAPLRDQQGTIQLIKQLSYVKSYSDYVFLNHNKTLNLDFERAANMGI